MDDLNRAVQWSDETYTDLEAEVEIEGIRLHSSPLSWLFRRREGVRRDKSLARAIRLAGERLISLEGLSGSGKTVALRHVALKLARSADTWTNNRPIGLYVNLKTLTRQPNEAIDARLIENHVRAYTNDLG